MQTTPSPARRAGALAVLLCWLWFSTAAAFTHTCASSRGEHMALTRASDAACSSCLWLACQKSVDVEPSPQVPLPRTVARVFVAPCVSPALTPAYPLSYRAPPA